jgi:hypothetical protein
MLMKLLEKSLVVEPSGWAAVNPTSVPQSLSVPLTNSHLYPESIPKNQHADNTNAVMKTRP